MKISDLLAAKGDAVETASRDETVGEVARRLTARGIGALVVPGADGGAEGIVSERDVVRLLAHEGAAALERTVADAMTSPVTTCVAEDEVLAIMATMTARRIRHVPVVDAAGRLAGIVSIGDVVKQRVDELERERRELLEYVSGR